MCLILGSLSTLKQGCESEWSWPGTDFQDKTGSILIKPPLTFTTDKCSVLKNRIQIRPQFKMKKKIWIYLVGWHEIRFMTIIYFSYLKNCKRKIVRVNYYQIPSSEFLLIVDSGVNTLSKIKIILYIRQYMSILDPVKPSTGSRSSPLAGEQKWFE